MAIQPPTVRQQIDSLLTPFPNTTVNKDRAIELALNLHRVSDEAIASVVGALDIAIPVNAWNAADVNDPAKVAEHAIEQGRYAVVTTLKQILAKRTPKKPE